MTGIRAAAAGALGLAGRAAPATAAGQVLLALAGGAVPVAIGLLTRQVVDRLATPGTGRLGTLLGLGVALATAGVATAALPLFARHLDAAWMRAVALRSQAGLYAAVNRLTGLSRLEDPKFRDRLRMAEEAGRNSPVAVAGGALEAVRGVVTAAGFVVTLAVLNPWMVAVVLLAALPTARAELVLARERARTAWRLSPAMRRQFFYSQLLTGLDAAKEIRLFGLAGLFGHRMLDELRTINVANARLERRHLALQASLAVLGVVVAGTGLVWAIRGAWAGRLSVGDVTIFIAAVAAVQGAVAGVIGRLAHAYSSVLMFVHYQEVLGAGPDLAGPAHPRGVGPLRRQIALHDVWFRYADDLPWVLRGVTLTIPCGATVALVGLNGAGKSTLVKLLVRFYDPTRGTVRWDGTDLRELATEELRNRIGAAFQDFMAYDLSAAENIGVGDLDALDDRDRLAQAARRAGVHDVLTALPGGYDTPLTRMFTGADDAADPGTGVLLSGGQWQRIALARSFLRADRDLLILDEPSAGLDAEAEADIHERLGRLRRGRTTLLITHRLSTVREADLVVVLSGGRIAEQGNHAELIASGGEYARLFRLQAAGYRDEATLP